ncbi:MAG: TrmH family RNA methyltransferase [Bdellovibrionota bacterium]
MAKAPGNSPSTGPGKLINEIYRCLQRADAEALLIPEDSDQYQLLLKDLETRWEKLATDFPKLYDLKRVFKNGWNRRKISDLLIAFERELGLHLMETDFLIDQHDKKIEKRPDIPLEIALDSIRSSFNVGGFLRTIEAFGLSHIHLIGYTPLPSDDGVKKTALGTETKINYTEWKQRDLFFSSMKEKGFRIIGVETSQNSVAVAEPWPIVPTVLIFGNERWGLDKWALSECDEIRRIPLLGEKNSLNVVVSGGIVIHEWIRQWGLGGNHG